MRPKTIVSALILLFALVAGWQLLNTPPGPPAEQLPTLEHSASGETDMASMRARISQLEADLASANASNAELLERLEILQQRESQALHNAQDLADTSEPHEGTGQSGAGSSIPALQALIDAGIPPATAEAMRDRVSENRLAMLNLRDRAEREGWLNSARYATELRKLINPGFGLREQFGDEMYDRFLYATGKSNRVIAADVYSASAAGAAGILPGDIVLSYASNNIYAMNDLKRATLEGEAGESVLVLLERDGVYFSITVPRGPLGIEMRMESHAPE